VLAISESIAAAASHQQGMQCNRRVAATIEIAMGAVRSARTKHGLEGFAGLRPETRRELAE
jgi:hypothetical protein